MPPRKANIMNPYHTKESLSFKQFLNQCDHIVASKIGLGIYDLPDAQWRDYYDSGLCPSDAVWTADDEYWDSQLFNIWDSEQA